MRNIKSKCSDFLVKNAGIIAASIVIFLIYLTLNYFLGQESEYIIFFNIVIIVALTYINYGKKANEKYNWLYNTAIILFTVFGNHLYLSEV